jgi:hypothetical protein
MERKTGIMTAGRASSDPHDFEKMSIREREMRLTQPGLLLSFGAVLLAPALQAAPPKLENPSKNVPAKWLTMTEESGFRKTPRYADTVAYSKRLADASPWIEYRSFGTSPEGRELPLLIVSSSGVFDADRAHEDGKLVVFVQNCIHAGESEGKDASFMLLRDIAITKTRASLLETVNLIVVPIFSVDGHERFGPYSRINQNGPDEMGWRVTSRNLNLNRDYLKADAVEMRHWLKLWNEWQPDLHFDNHTTDGGDWQYDITFASDTHPTGDPGVTRWLRDIYYPNIIPALERDGHVTATYFGLVDGMDPTKGVRSGGMSPRFSTGYVSLRNRPSVLVETHMLKDYRTRVIATYNIMRHSLELLNRDPDTLRDINRTGDATSTRLGDPGTTDRDVVVSLKPNEHTEPVTFRGYASRRELSEVSGGIRVIYDNTTEVEFETTARQRMDAKMTVVAPLAYVIPPQWTEVITTAQRHGLSVQRLKTSTTIPVESYRFSDVKFASRPFEGRFMATYTSERFETSRTFMPGSAVITLDQPGAKVAVHLFEPDAPDSLLAWGFFSAIFEQKEYGEHYMLEALARDMMQKDPALREEFETKVRTDKEFASNRWARLSFFYERSPYWDDRLNVYPIGRIVSPVSLDLELLAPIAE